MTRTATAILAAAIALGTIAALAIADEQTETITGGAFVLDGDTIRVGRRLYAAPGVSVRLWGIDAPESHQTCLDAQRRPYACGEASTRALANMLARDPAVTCQARAFDKYGRVVAICSNSGGDLGARLVARGLAVAYRKYSTAYVDHEAAAKAERLGLWSGSFEQPETWRRENKR